jgi:hypothetical protein
MLLLQPPGQSLYSRLVVPEDSPRPCDDACSFLCSPPRWSRAHEAHTIAEPWLDGLHRYVTIAHAFEAAVFDAPRFAPRDELWRYALALTFAESGFRRDVHEGLGEASRGDCDWVEYEPGKFRRIPGSCKSHCLIQRQLGPLGRAHRTKEGWSAKQLVGTDYDSTWRCVSVGVRIVDAAYQSCSKRGPGRMSRCIVQFYAGGGIAADDERVSQRVRLINMIWRAPTRLERDAQLALGLAADEGDNDDGRITAAWH